MEELRFLDLVAETILDIEVETGGEPPISHALRQTAGAILRQMLDEYGSEDPRLITEELIYKAYLNEMIRVIDGWPATIDFIRPHSYLSCSRMFQTHLAEWGFCEQPSDMQAFRGYMMRALDDPSMFVTIFNDRFETVFASPNTMKFLSLQPEESHSGLTWAEAMVHPIDIKRLTDGLKVILDGGCIHDQTFRASPASFAERIAVKYAGNILGADVRLWVWKPIFAHEVQGRRVPGLTTLLASPEVTSEAKFH